MSKYEKLGSFLLFEKIDEDKLSKNFLAGQIVNNEIQDIHLLKKFDHSLSTLPDFILDLNQEYEILKQLSNPSILRPSSLVQERSEFAVVFDYLEGKSLRSVLQRCNQEGYPFTVDHALLVASRLCTAIEYLHSKKVNEERLVHGFICPETIQVGYDGEIKLFYLALAHSLLKFPAGREKLFHDGKSYLSPEVLSNQKLDRSSDIYGAGVVLFEMLTGEVFSNKSREGNVLQVLEQAQIQTNSGDRAPLPEDIKKVLSQSLAHDPAQRYSSIGDMRKALDKLLFSNEFSPNTFNLAFFMHSLFRENIDEEIKSINNFKKIDVTSFLKEEPPPPPKPEHPVGAEAAKDFPSLGMEKEGTSAFGSQEMFVAAKTKEKSKTPLFLSAAVVLAVLAMLGYLYWPGKSSPTQTASTGLSVEQQKEQQRLQMEATLAQEEVKKKDEALKELQNKLDELLKAQQDTKKAAGTTTQVDAAAIQQLQEQARKLEEEKKRQQALAEEKLKAAQQPPPAATPEETSPESSEESYAESSAEVKPQQPPPTTTQQVAGSTQQIAAATQPPVTTTPSPAPAETKPQVQQTQEPQAAPATNAGEELQLTPDMVKPELVNRVNPSYPPAAQARRIEGTVILSVLVSESGDVADVKVLRAAGGSSGLNEAATAAVRKWKFRPAVKDGVRVRVWITYPIVFKLR